MGVGRGAGGAGAGRAVMLSGGATAGDGTGDGAAGVEAATAAMGASAASAADTTKALSLLEKLAEHHSLTLEEYEFLAKSASSEVAARAASLAREACEQVYDNAVFVRGLIEIGNHCANDCLYCGIRRSNKQLERYRLSAEQVLECADAGYALGCRTFVLQSGEDPALADDSLCRLIYELKRRHADCAVTLSLGERTRKSYQRLFNAGADRYLLRHETACPKHYAMLHPSDMSHERRLRCLADLADIGYAVGMGFMVGSPGQGSLELARDLKLVEQLHPAMCGIGPFVAHHSTPFASKPCGSVELTCYLLSLLRLIKPNLLLPATTSLATLDARGYERGIEAGANVIMPNVSPQHTRKLYDLYDNKAQADCGATTLQEKMDDLHRRMGAIGRKIVANRGDARKEGE